MNFPGPLELLCAEKLKPQQQELWAGPTVGAVQPSLGNPRVSAQLVLMVASLGYSSVVRKDNS